MLSVISAMKKYTTPLKTSRPEGMASVLTKSLAPEVRDRARQVLATALSIPQGGILPPGLNNPITNAMANALPKPSLNAPQALMATNPPSQTAPSIGAAGAPDYYSAYLSYMSAAPSPPPAAPFFNAIQPPQRLREILPEPPSAPTLENVPPPTPEMSTLSGLLALAYPYVGLDVLAAQNIALEAETQRRNQLKLAQYQAQMDQYKAILQRTLAISEDEWKWYDAKIQTAQRLYNQALEAWKALREDVANAAKIQLSAVTQEQMAKLESDLRQKETLARIDAETRSRLQIDLFTNTTLQAMLATAQEPVLEFLKAYGIIVSPEMAKAIGQSPAVLSLMWAQKTAELEAQKMAQDIQHAQQMFPLQVKQAQANIALTQAQAREAQATAYLRQAQAKHLLQTPATGAITPYQQMSQLQQTEDRRLTQLLAVERDLNPSTTNIAGLQRFAQISSQKINVGGVQMNLSEAINLLIHKGRPLINTRKSMYAAMALTGQPDQRQVQAYTSQLQDFVKTAAMVAQGCSELYALGKTNPSAGQAAVVGLSRVGEVTNIVVPPEHLVPAIEELEQLGIPGGQALLKELNIKRSTSK